MFNITLKRSVAALAVTAGLLATAGPASAILYNGHAGLGSSVYEHNQTDLEFAVAPQSAPPRLRQRGPASSTEPPTPCRWASPPSRDAAFRRSARRDGLAAPFLGRCVGQGLGERPLVARGILGVVLALAVLEVGQLHHDPRTVLARLRAVRPRVLDAHQHRRGRLAGPRRPAAAADVGDDDRAVADTQLRAMALADPDALDEPERGSEPLDRLAYIG